MRLLVTGGAGFVGSHVVEHSLQAGFEVAVLDDLSTGKASQVPKQAKLYLCDLRDREPTFSAIRDFRPQVVSHQAARASVAASVKDARLDWEVALMGGLNLLDACTAPAASVERFVFASSGGAVYGDIPEGERATEDRRCTPESPYAISKLAFEQLLATYGKQRGLSSTVLRYANVYGPRQDSHGEAGVVASFLASAYARRRLVVYGRVAAGDEGCVRDYVLVTDVARANVLAERGELSHTVSNVGTGFMTTTLELAQKVARVTQTRPEIAHAPPRVGDVRRSVLDVSRLRTALGELTDLDTGLAKTASYFRENR